MSDQISRDRLEKGLRNAHAAGNNEAAVKFANAIKAMAQPKAESYTKETLSNVPGSAAGVAKDMAYAAMNPVDTAKGAVRAGAGGLEKLYPEVDVNKDSSSFMKYMFGHQNAPSSYEPYADTVGEHYGSRWGSVEKIKENFKNDPVGMAFDVPIPAMATMGAGKTVARASAAAIPEKFPGKLYQSAAKFSTTLPEKERMAHIDTAMEHRLMPSASGVNKMNEQIFAYNDQISDIIDSATTMGELIPKQALYKYNRQVLDDLGGVKLDAASDTASAIQYIKQFDEHLRSIDGDMLTPAQVQRFKIDAYSKIKFDGKQLKSSHPVDEIRRGMAKGAKEALEPLDPRIKDLNQKEGALLGLQPHLIRSAGRVDNRDVFGLGATVKLGAAAALDQPWLAATALADMPKPKAWLAMQLNKMKKKERTRLLANPLAQGLLVQQSLLQGGALNEEFDIKGLLNSTEQNAAK